MKIDLDDFFCFSPVLLFIRSMSIVIIHKSQFDIDMFTECAGFNARMLTHILEIQNSQK
jgi:hypothetical protein